MQKKKSSCYISHVNLSLFGKKFSLMQSNRRVYNIDEIYGVFLDDHTFQFVRESSLPFEEWEKVEDESPFIYYELVHKRQFQLFQLSGSYLTGPFVGDIPWHRGEIVDMQGHSAIPVKAKNFIPKRFIRCNKITDTDLEYFSSYISKILATNSSLLEDFFVENEIQKVI